MKAKLLIVFLGFAAVSCSGSKETLKTKEVKVTTSNNIATPASSQNNVSGEINTKINTIIQNYLGVPISSIARSDVQETEKGYQWKFMNVKTGENFTANSDFTFDSIKITKNKRS
ncbi:hypothetical protein [Aquimarina sp. 433]